MKLSSRAVFWIILGSFFLSGLAGLLYQVVWTRYLALFLGHTSYAVVAVLVSFMGGLAVGNAWLGAKVDQLRRPLRFYGWLEIAIGIYALMFPYLYEVFEDAFLGMVRSLQPGGALLLALKFAVAAVAILPPTILMGATLPALTRYVTRSLAELRGKVAALYAINSTGAVAGILLADWWWIPALGLEYVVQLGALFSLAIGVVSLTLSRRAGEDAPAAPLADGGTTSPTDEVFSPAELRLALIGIGVSGFVAMLYEVAWTRLLGLAIGSSTHAYSLMLITFITGIATGGWIIYRWKTQGRTLQAFGWAELGLAASLAVSLFFYDLLPYWFVKLASNLSRQPSTFLLYELCQGLLCFLVMFVPATCLGMTLPLVSRVATAELTRTGRSVGLVFAVNTLGTVLGAALTGLVLLPVFGLVRTFALGVILNAAIAVAVLIHRTSSRTRIAAVSVGMATFAAALVAAFTLHTRWQKGFSFGLWRSPGAPPTVAQYRKIVSEFNLASCVDGAGSTVAIALSKLPDGNTNVSLRVNGKADASLGMDICTQLLAGHVPALLHPSPKNTLVVGAGSGMTAGALLTHPDVERVDLVEISPEVVHAAKTWFATANERALESPRLHLAVEDAKTFLKTTPHKYDIIITEPSNPWMAGVAAVFSTEYYLSCQEKLNPGGLVAQWLQIYETDDTTLSMVLKTFTSVFHHASVWQTAPGDLLIVGSPTAVTLDPNLLARRMQTPSVAKDLARMKIHRPATLLCRQHIPMGDAIFIPRPDIRIHSDFFPVLEYAAQKAFFVRSASLLIDRISSINLTRNRTLLNQWIREHPLTAEDCEDMMEYLKFNESASPKIQRSLIYKWLELDPKSEKAVRRLGELALIPNLGEVDPGPTILRPEYRNEEVLRHLDILRSYAGMHVLSHRMQRSAFYSPSSRLTEPLLKTADTLDVSNRRSHRLRLAEVIWDRGDDTAFLAELNRALSAEENSASEKSMNDPATARIAISRAFETAIQKHDGTLAMTWYRNAVTSGYLKPEDEGEHPLLFILARRIEAEFGDAR